MENDVIHVAGGLHLRLYFDPQPSGTHTKEQPFHLHRTERNRQTMQEQFHAEENNLLLNKMTPKQSVTE